MKQFNKSIKHILPNNSDEVWKKINGYEAEISNYGRIRSLITNKLLHIVIDKNGYENIVLWNKDKQERFLIHRLVAIHFVHNNNPAFYNTVNHIDENKNNNHYLNLEWCDDNYNNTYSKGHKIKCIDINTGEFKVFDSTRKAGKYINKSGTFIQRALKNNTTYNNYKWERMYG